MIDERCVDNEPGCEQTFTSEAVPAGSLFYCTNSYYQIKAKGYGARLSCKNSAIKLGPLNSPNLAGQEGGPCPRLKLESYSR
jgi:hypothetical protein